MTKTICFCESRRRSSWAGSPWSTSSGSRCPRTRWAPPRHPRWSSITIPGGVPALLAQHHRRSRHPPLLHVPAPQQTLLRVLPGVHRQGGSDLQNTQNPPDIQTVSSHHRAQNSGLHSKKQSTVIINHRLPVWSRASCPLPGSCCCWRWLWACVCWSVRAWPMLLRRSPLLMRN